MENFKNPDFIANIALHTLILFTFLALFFFYYISDITKKAFTHETEQLINDKLDNEILDTIKSSEIYKKIMEILPIDKIKNIYNKPHELVEEKNTGLKHTVFAIIITSWVFLSFSFYLFNDKLDLTHLLIDNFGTFLFVGIIEYLFFTEIAYKFIPIPPSFLVTEFYNQIGSLLT